MTSNKRTSARPQPARAVGRKPIRPIDRQKMRPWLVNLLDHGTVPSLKWVDKQENTFEVTWRHAARHGWDLKNDAEIFERWARHTGKFVDGDSPDPKRWKANFRCALHSLPDVIEIKETQSRKGQNARRIYQFTDGSQRQSKKKRCRRPSCHRRLSYEDDDVDDSEIPRDVKPTIDLPELSTDPLSPPITPVESSSILDTPFIPPNARVQAPIPLAVSEEEVRMEFVESPVLPKFDQIIPNDRDRNFAPRRPFARMTSSGGTMTVNEARPVSYEGILGLGEVEIQEMEIRDLAVLAPVVRSLMMDVPQSPTSDSRDSLPLTPPHGSFSPEWASDGEDSGVSMSDEEVLDLVTQLGSSYNPSLWNSEISIDGQVPADEFMSTDGVPVPTTDGIPVHVMQEPTIPNDFRLTADDEV